MNLAGDLERLALTDPDAPALVFDDERPVTFGELDAAVDDAAALLRELGVERGDRVMVLAGNVPAMFPGWLAPLKLGAVTVPVNVMLAADEIAFLIRDCRPRAVFVTAALLERARPALEAAAGDVVTIVADGPAPWPGAIGLPDAVRTARGPVRSLDLDPLTPAVIGYTSGTTGFPKGALHSHLGASISIDALARRLELRPGDSGMQVLPLASLVMMLGGPLMVWRLGGTLYLNGRFSAARTAELIRRRRPVYMGIVPTMLHDLASLPPGAERALDSLRVLICGASRLDVQTRDAFERRFGLAICNGFGQTEVPGVIASDPLSGERRAGAVGTPHPHVAVTIRGDDDEPLGPGEVGEICAEPSSPGSFVPMLGYWERPDGTAEALRRGRLHTGDVGYLDEDGFLFLVDRKREVIIRGGHNVYPAEVERALQEDERVAECAVVGVPAERLGEVPVAVVVLAPGASASEQDLDAMLRRSLASYKVPVRFVLRDALPKNHLGKILRQHVRDELRAEADAAADA